MHVGILQFVTPHGMPVVDVAPACEQRGIESLWVPEHPVVPVDYATRYPLSADGKLPRAYTELPDPFPLLAAAAAVTKRLKLGTGICLVPERDALMTALQVATVDWISNGWAYLAFTASFGLMILYSLAPLIPGFRRRRSSEARA